MDIYNIKDKPEFMKEVILLEHNQWSLKKLTDKELDIKIREKEGFIKSNYDNPWFCKLVLVDGDDLIGFISMFPADGDERSDLSPWYATMYVKEKYRGKGYSKLLNDAILKEARIRGFEKLYLKTNLDNYYEKFGAKYVEDLNNGEKLYYIETSGKQAGFIASALLYGMLALFLVLMLSTIYILANNKMSMDKLKEEALNIVESE